MKTVTCTVAGDVIVDGEKKALHFGQVYELPDDVAKALISSDRAFAGTPPEPAKKEAAPAQENKQEPSPPATKDEARPPSRRSTTRRN